MAGVYSSSRRARIHRSIQTATVAFPAGGLGTNLTLDVTIAAVNSPRYIVSPPNGFEIGGSGTGNFVQNYTLTTTTNLRITWTRASGFLGRTEPWLIEEFF